MLYSASSDRLARILADLARPPMPTSPVAGFVAGPRRPRACYRVAPVRTLSRAERAEVRAHEALDRATALGRRGRAAR